MDIEIREVLEGNGKGVLAYAENFPGAYVRGPSAAEAEGKWPEEIRAYLRWRDGCVPDGLCCRWRVVQEKHSGLEVQDADSDVLFDSEGRPMTESQYQAWRDLALRSAADFLALYRSIPDPNRAARPPRQTFYGPVPRTAEEMYVHTKNVNNYYFGEVGVEVGNGPDILQCRREGFALLERQPGFLENKVFDGSYGELWSAAKVLRRFLWHDRIHARAMFRMAGALWEAGQFLDPFRFAEVPPGACKQAALLI